MHLVFGLAHAFISSRLPATMNDQTGCAALAEIIWLSHLYPDIAESDRLCEDLTTGSTAQ
jgi:hypothetical protein